MSGELKEMYKRLKELDNNLSKLTKDETIDSRVSFEYEIKQSRKDDKGILWYPIKLFISPKAGYDLHNIQKVIYLLHPTFNPSKVAISNVESQFALEFESWGDFYAMAIIMFNTKDTLKLIKYLPVGKDQANYWTSFSTDQANYWTKFAMNQANYWTSFSTDQTRS